jgi:hypothetical protein
MRTGRLVLQVLRTPALLMLLWLTGPAVEARYRAMNRFAAEEMRGQWALVCLLGTAFVVVMLVGRRHRQPWALLAVEAAVAAAIAYVPPLTWITWGGVDGPGAAALVGGLAQPLAMAWLGVTGLCVVEQLRGRQDAAGPSGDGKSPGVAHTPLDLIDRTEPHRGR